MLALDVADSDRNRLEADSPPPRSPRDVDRDRDDGGSGSGSGGGRELGLIGGLVHRLCSLMGVSGDCPIFEPRMHRDVCVCSISLLVFMIGWFYVPLVVWYGGVLHYTAFAHDVTMLGTAITDACNPFNPCRNNAPCIVLNPTPAVGTPTATESTLSFRCQCPVGFHGQLCERKVTSASTPAAKCGRGRGSKRVNPLLRHLLSDYTAESVWRHLIDQYVHIDPARDPTTTTPSTASIATATARSKEAPIAVEVGSTSGASSVYAAQRGFQVMLIEGSSGRFTLPPPSRSTDESSDSNDNDAMYNRYGHGHGHGSGHARRSNDGSGSGSYYGRLTTSSYSTVAPSPVSIGALRFSMCAHTIRQFERHRSEGRRWRRWWHHGDSDGGDDDDDDDDRDDDDDHDDDDHERKRRKSKVSAAGERTEVTREAVDSVALVGKVIGRGHVELIRAVAGDDYYSSLRGRLALDRSLASQYNALRYVTSPATASVGNSDPASLVALSLGAPPVVALDDLLRASKLSNIYVLKLNGPFVEVPSNDGSSSILPASAQALALSGLRQSLCEHRILYVLLSGYWPRGMTRFADSAPTSASVPSSVAGVGGRPPPPPSTPPPTGDDVLQWLWDADYTVYDLKMHSPSTPTPTSTASTPSPVTTDTASTSTTAKRKAHSGHGHHSLNDKLATLAATRAPLRISNRRPLAMNEYNAWLERNDRSASTSRTPSSSIDADHSDTTVDDGVIRGAVWTDLLAVANTADLSHFVEH